MKQVTSFNRTNCADVEKHMMAVLEAEAAKMGLAVQREGRGKFSSDSFRFEIKFICGGEQGAEDKAREEFGMWARYYGLEAQDYGAIITIRGTKYKLVKINSRRGVKYPFECERVDGGNGIRLPDVYKHEILAARGK